MRFDGLRAPFYEIYFIEVQDEAARSGLWVRYTLRSPVEGADKAVAELWAMYFDREDPARNHALKKTVPFRDAVVGRGPFRFAIGDAELTQHGCRGGIGDGDKRIEWDLRWGDDKLLVHFPFERMYTGPLPKSKVVSPHYDLRATGSYRSGARRFEIADAPGQQSHLWGTQYAHRWIWGHANTFKEDRGAVFEALSAQIKLGPFTVPHLTLIALHYEGRDYLLNTPSDLARNNESHTDAGSDPGDYHPVARWSLGGGNDDIRVRADLWADVPTYLGVRYQDPNGAGLICCHSKLACARVEIMRPDGHGGWRNERPLTLEGSAAIEFVGRRGDPRVPVLI